MVITHVFKSAITITNFPTGITKSVPADAIENTGIVGIDTQTFLELWNGVTYDRIRSSKADGSSIGAIGVVASGMVVTNGVNFFAVADPVGSLDGGVGTNIVSEQGYIFNGATYDRIRSANGVQATTGTGLPGSAPMVFDGTNYSRVGAANNVGDGNSGGNEMAVQTNVFNSLTYDRLRNSSAANMSSVASQPFALLVQTPGEWAQGSAPAAATQATTTKAGAAGVKHICKTISWSIAAVAAQGSIQINLRDSTTGAGVILWTKTVVLPVGGYANGDINVNIPGTTGNAMTLESSAAPAATNFASVSMTGIDTV